MPKRKRITWPKIVITETRLVNAVFTVSPWLTPIITAWIVYNSTRSPDGLAWEPLQAFVAAAIIETNGISSTNLLMYLYREKADRALLFIAAGIVGVYAASVLALTMLLDTFPQMAKFAPILFVFLVLSSNATVALRAHHKAVKADGKMRKVARKVSESSEKVSESFPPNSKSFTPDHWRILGSLEVPEIMERTGRCQKTAQTLYKQARNGHKVEDK